MNLPDQQNDRFVRDPTLLVDLCREVIQQLDAELQSSEIKEMTAQLREISRTIERLNKAKVPIPDALRAEKIRLSTSLGVKSEAADALGLLSGEFAALHEELQSRLPNKTPKQSTAKKKTKKKKRVRKPKTSNEILRQEIIRALKKHGGRARVASVIEEIGIRLDGKLLAGDLIRRESTNEYAWQNNVKWERYKMVLDGILKNGSPRGIWELSKEYA